ncbi:hypothetical protein [Pseudonocardia sp. TRM90224]|uniref:hypothetical protein n=1 Tax=Pseudonocardia sp. TRM90224 TaxID=2812678 RepID=UPI001E5DE630|nr:hypothetical protein [Pseudonocardia sp. TRM90224]
MRASLAWTDVVADLRPIVHRLAAGRLVQPPAPPTAQSTSSCSIRLTAAQLRALIPVVLGVGCIDYEVMRVWMPARIMSRSNVSACSGC